MSNRHTIAPAIQVGDTVAFTDGYIDRHSQYPNDMKSAQGQVRTLHRLKSGIILADIDWNKPGLPKRVSLKNLTKLGAASLAE